MREDRVLAVADELAAEVVIKPNMLLLQNFLSFIIQCKEKQLANKAATFSNENVNTHQATE